MADRLGFAVEWNPWLILAAAILVSACLTASVLTCRRLRWRPGLVATELLRMLIVGALFLTLMQPEWRADALPRDKPDLVVLEDQSRSMDTQDAGNDGAPVSRRSVVETSRQSRVWAELGEIFTIRRQGFAQSASGGTDLHEALEAAGERRPAVVVILSDGDWNEGANPMEAVPGYLARGTRVSSVVTGGTEHQPDVGIAQWALPVRAGVGEDVRIPVLMRNRFAEPVFSVLRFSVDGRQVEERSLTLAPGIEREEAFVWKAEEAGDYEIEVVLDSVPGEASMDNNRVSGTLQAGQQRTKVLIVESLPRWEYRFLRNALERDPGVEVDCLLFHPGAGMEAARGPAYLEAFPSSLSALGSYDVLFFGDVGMGDGELREEELERVKSLVEDQASGLVIMPGPRGAWRRLAESPVAPLMPVSLDEAEPSGVGRSIPARLELARAAVSSPLTMLADTPEENRAVWESLPGFFWHAPVIGVKVGGEVLAVHEAARAPSGRLPLLVTRPAGRGKVLFMGTDGAWRWRRGVEDRFHYRFWGQVVRWMAYQRKMAAGKQARLMFSPERPVGGEPVMITASVLGEDQGPLESGAVIVEARSERGEASSVLKSEEIDWGTFTGTMRFPSEGDYSIRLKTELGQIIDYTTEITVDHKPVEGVGESARPEVLEGLARATGGIVVRPDSIDSLREHLADLPVPPAREIVVEWWNRPGWASLLVGMLGLYWFARKRQALV